VEKINVGLRMKTTLDLINNTPLVYLDKISAGLKGQIFGKLEFVQPGGSVKDRSAYQIIKDAYADNTLKKGQAVVEMTSGNMGAGLAMVCKQLGNPFIAVMPSGNSPERLKILRALGAEVILTEQVDGKQGMVTGKDIDRAKSVAINIARERNGFFVDQFNNPSSIKAHFETTGPEIFEALETVDGFVAIIGTGGTFIGTGRYLKSKNPRIKCIAVEPENAAILKTGKVDDPKHIIQGTSYGEVPPHWDASLVDEIITVSDGEVREMTIRLAMDQGLYVGYSSGANVLAATKYLEKTNVKLKLVTMLCDSGYKYSDL